MSSRRIKLSNLSDEEIVELMDSVTSGSEDDGDFSSDDELNDPNYELDPIYGHDSTINQILSDPEFSINVDPSEFGSMIDAVSLSLNLSSIGTLPEVGTGKIGANETVVMESIVEPIASTSTAVQAIPPRSTSEKRLRSPLPTFDPTRPSVAPSNAGFTGAG